MSEYRRAPLNTVISRPGPMLVALMMAAGLSVACEKPAPAAAPPTEVYVTDVVQKDVPVYLELVGQTKGFQDVDIRARVEGFLETVNFREGSLVRKGDLLYEIDRKPLEAILAAAKADQATAQARLEKASNDVARYTPLVAKQAVSQQELDNARAAQDAATAQVEAAKAAVEKATLDLSYTRITSPIDGLAGHHAGEAGQSRRPRREHAAHDDLADRSDPLPGGGHRGRLPALRQASGARQTGDAPRAADIQLTLADGSVYAHTGRVNLVERAVDPTTGTLGIELEFPNPDRAAAARPVRPGAAAARNQDGRPAGSAAGRPGTAEHLQRGRGGRGQQGGVSHREGRPARRLALGDRGRRSSRASASWSKACSGFRTA